MDNVNKYSRDLHVEFGQAKGGRVINHLQFSIIKKAGEHAKKKAAKVTIPDG